MDETVWCPGCQARLTLPSLPAGQTVQCPRCRQVFEPYGQRSKPAVIVEPPAPLSIIQVHNGTVQDEIADLADDGTADDPRLVGRPEPLRGERRATIAIVMLAACILSYGVQFYINFERAQLIQLEQELREPLRFVGWPDFGQPVDPRFADLDRRWENLEQFGGLANLLHHAIYWPTMVVFLIWFHRAYRNLQNLKANGLSDIPILATASFFVPILNLFRPYLVVQRIWRASDPRFISPPESWTGSPRALSVRFWWFFFLSASVLSTLRLLASAADQGRLGDDELIASQIASASNLCMIVAGLLLIFIIRVIAQRQRERYIRLYEDRA
jgi:hypothetical protein